MDHATHRAVTRALLEVRQLTNECEWALSEEGLDGLETLLQRAMQLGKEVEAIAAAVTPLYQAEKARREKSDETTRKRRETLAQKRRADGTGKGNAKTAAAAAAATVRAKASPKPVRKAKETTKVGVKARAPKTRTSQRPAAQMALAV